MLLERWNRFQNPNATGNTPENNEEDTQMKKLFAMLLVLAMVLSMAACGASAPAATEAPAATQAPAAEKPAEAPAAEGSVY